MATTHRDFILPDLGEGLTEAEIVNWLVAEGDSVVVDQPIIEVESAKSIVELPCPFAGVVEKLHAGVGDTIRSGQPIITVAVEARATQGAGADTVPGTALRGDPAAAPAGADVAVQAGYGAGGVGGTGGTGGRRAAREGRFGRRGAGSAADAGSGAEASPAVTGMAATAPSPSPRRLDDSASAITTSPGRTSPVVSPLVRRIARDHGFSAHSLDGSGNGGLVLRADVERVIAERGEASGSPVPVAQGTAIVHAEGDIRIPITGLRKVVAERMSASRREVPEATIWLDVDATELLAAKEQLQRSTGERWSLNALLARFVVAGLKQWPILNSSVDTAAGEIVQHSAINLGIAAQTGRGLMVPVIHGAGDMTTGGLRDALTDLVETAKTGNFPNDQLRGGTFTLNNYGGFGMDGSAPIINQPEVAMLGVGRILDRPWVVDGQIVVRKIMVLSMVFDHRVCDGDVPSEFMGFITRCIQNPIALLGEL